jgi:LysM repeat protein
MRFRNLALAVLIAFGLTAPLSAHAEPSGKKPAASSSKKSKTKYERTDHTVKKGDTLGEIASTYGVKTDDVIRWNKLSSAHAIRAGQRLEIYTPASSSASSSRAGSKSSAGSTAGSGKRVKHKTTYAVKKGDTLGKIAEKQGVTTKQLLAWNPKLKGKPHAIKIGQQLTIVQEGPDTSSASIGHAAKGKLVNGEQLPSSPHYFIRNSARVFATNLTVSALLDTTAKLKKKHSHAPQIVIGDISLKGGGPMKPHKSHQSGRDVDLGYYHKGNRQLDNFEVMNRHNLDVEKTWDYLMILLSSGKVDYVFIDYGIQRLLYDHARGLGVSEAQLEKTLQYPHGKGFSGPQVKHEPGHINHMHVRFSCASGDAHCH